MTIRRLRQWKEERRRRAAKRRYEFQCRCEHRYKWVCIFCGRDEKNHFTPCFARDFRQECVRCGARGPNGGN